MAFDASDNGRFPSFKLTSIDFAALHPPCRGIFDELCWFVLHFCATAQRAEPNRPEHKKGLLQNGIS
jgi:hypothetical protein